MKSMQNNDTDTNEAKKLLSIGEAANYLGISIDTLRRWGKKEKIETYRSPGGHRYYKKSDLDNLFGTRYERTEPTIRRASAIEEIKPETEKPDVAEEIIPPAELEAKEETIVQMKSYNGDKLVVPSFSPNRMYSKYDKMLSNVSIPINPPLIKPPVTEQKDSVLVPSTLPQNPLPVSTQKQAEPNQQQTTKSNPEPQKQFSINLSLKNILIIFVVLIIVVALILFVIGLATPKVLSPIP